MNKDLMKKQIDAASKRIPADLVIKGGQIVDVFNLKLIEADIAISDGMIVGIGEYSGLEEIDATGKIIAPSFIDAHVHIESSLVTPKEFAKVVLPRGVTTVITDPHEIANVSGEEGISFMLEDSEGLDLDVYIMLPSSVPCTPFENAGAILNNEELESFYEHPRVLGLAEVMDLPSVRNSEEKMAEKILAARNNKKHIDGHCAGFNEDGINIYRTAGVKTDHESVLDEEIDMRIARGMYVLIREGSTTRNLTDLISKVTPYNARRFMFCTDDKNIDDLVYEGSIDYNIRLAIQQGMNPLQAIQLATLNAVECYRLEGKGAVAPGYIADLVILSDLSTIQIDKVIKNGKVISENGRLTSQPTEEKPHLNTYSNRLTDSVRIDSILEKDLQINLGDKKRVRVIEIIPDQIVTNHIIEDIEAKNNYFTPDPGKDLAKLAVIERHHRTGNIGLGIVRGLNLVDGAIASTVAHDSHNLVVAGTNNRDMLKAIEVIKEINGGLVVVKNEQVIGRLELSISGIMSNQNYEKVLADFEGLIHALEAVSSKPKSQLFITLSFLSLPVIPELKLTDKGLFDVNKFKHVSIEV